MSICRYVGPAALWLCLTTASARAQQIYYLDSTLATINRMNLDGTNVQTVLSGAGTGSVMEGLDLDLDAGTMYWVNHRGVMRATLSGVDDVLVVPEFIPADRYMGIALDRVNDRIYYTTRSEIRRTHLDGSAAETLVAAIGHLDRVVLDATNNKMYWVERESDVLQRSDLDGTNVETLPLVDVNLPGVAIDHVAGMVYYARSATGMIHRASLDGGNPEAIVAHGGHIVSDIKLDVANNHVYWSSVPLSGLWGSIRRANLDGSDAIVLATPRRPTSIALDPRECSDNGTLVGGTCQCDAGWENDACTCSTMGCGQDCSNQGTCVCGVCQCDPGFEGEDCSEIDVIETRLFMATDGSEAEAAASGHTTVFVERGENVRVHVWFEDTTPDLLFQGAQVLLDWPITPLDGASGLVTYQDLPAEPICAWEGLVDVPCTADADCATFGEECNLGTQTCANGPFDVYGLPCSPSDPQACAGFPTLCVATGNSIAVVPERPDFVLYDQPIIPPLYVEQSGTLFGFAFVHLDTNDGTAVDGIRYMGDFVVEASSDAGGVHTLRVIPEGGAIGGTTLIAAGINQYPLDLVQDLHIVVTDCGNGQLEGPETCDDGNATPGDGCTDCVTDVCGDGTTNNGGMEECDDGNMTPGDGCSDNCIVEFCGDGAANNVTEECDDGNTADGDGCAPDCTIEPALLPVLSVRGMLLLCGLLFAGACCARRQSHA